MAPNLIAFGVLLAVGTSTALDVTDLKQLAAAKASGKITLRDIDVPAGVTLDLDKLKPGTLVEFAGRITFGYKEWIGPLIKATGKNITIVGLPGHLIDCQGERWWDHKGGNGGKKKPKFFSLKLENSEVTGLSVKNLPVHGFSVNGCKKTKISKIYIDGREGSVKGGHNTDGFDVGNCDQVEISDCQVYNQDDCLAVNSGTNINFINNFCSGGHGISIGSVGGRKNNVVANVTVRHCVVTDSSNGIRIKTIKGATGRVSGIIFDDVELINIGKRGIVIQGNYLNGGPNGDPTGGCPVTDVTINNVRGNVSPKGANTYVWVDNAFNWKCSNVNVTGGNKKLENKGLPAECQFS